MAQSDSKLSFPSNTQDLIKSAKLEPEAKLYTGLQKNQNDNLSQTIISLKEGN